MAISESTKKYLHSKLPIDENENILAVYRHHWFAYFSTWIIGVFIIIVVMVFAFVFTSLGGADSSLAQHKSQIISGAAAFCLLVLLGTFLPVYLRSQEQVVLTEEALLQMLQPSLFASKVDQLNLQHIADVSVTQDFFGTMLGYGHITIETPGEQNNYRFSMLPNPHQAAREISQAHENYDAALQGGRMHTTLGDPQQPAAAPQVDMAQYQQFLQYQQMVAQQQATNGQSEARANQPDESQQTAQPASPQSPPQSPAYPPNTGTGGDQPAAPSQPLNQ